MKSFRKLARKLSFSNSQLEEQVLVPVRHASLPEISSIEEIETTLLKKHSLVEEMRKITPLELDIPGLVVLGNPESGKSSILSLLTGVALPPNTQRPIVVRLQSDPSCQSDYAIVGGAAGRPHTSRRIPVSELATEILRVQRDMTTGASSDEDEVAPQAKEPIYVRVVRPTGPTYTFVDLPGYQEAEEVNGRLVENVVNKQIESYLNAPNFIIMAVLPVTDIFENVEVIHLAKKYDPEGKRTLGVVSKMDLVEIQHNAVEKINMTNQRDVILPFGYVAVRVDPSVTDRNQAVEVEKNFFSSHALLRGLRPDRFGISVLKKRIVDFQTMAISARVPEMRKKLVDELALVERELKETRPSFSSPAEFLAKISTEINDLSFDLGDLMTSSRTRGERNLNVGARFYDSVQRREAETRKRLPDFLSADYVNKYLTKELAEFRGVVNSNESLLHPIFFMAIREGCGQLLREYSANLLSDAAAQVREATNVLIDERFCDFPRLVESLRQDILKLQAAKQQECNLLVEKLLKAELSWVFVSEEDYVTILKKVDSVLAEEAAAPNPEVAFRDHHSVRGLQIALHEYAQLMLKRVFAVVPMNIRNNIMVEFRQELVGIVAHGYTDESRLRMLMAEELWFNQLRAQRVSRASALQEVLSKVSILA